MYVDFTIALPSIAIDSSMCVCFLHMGVFFGTGEKALVYLVLYLYRGVIQEKHILACENGQVAFRYQNSKTKKRR